MTLRKTKQFFRKPSVLGAIIGILAIALIGVLFIQTTNQNNTLIAQQTADIATATALAWTATPPPQAVILTGEKWTSDKVVPSEDQTALAKSRIGQNGFIAYIACNQTSEYHASLTREVFDAASKLKLPLHIYDSNNDEYLQVTLIDRARSDGAVGIILCPLKIDLLKDSLSSVQDAHFPLVIFSDQPPSYGGVLIGGDNYLIGLDPGRFAGKIIHDEMSGKADVIILDYPSIESIVARANGLEDGVKEFAPDANIVGRYIGGTIKDGEASVAQLIKDGVKFNFIVSINDAGSLGAIQAMQDAGFDCKSVTVVSLDAEALAQQFIRDGCFMRGSVENSRKNPAQAMVDAMVQLLAGSEIAETIIIPPGPIITKDLLEQTDATATAVVANPPSAEATPEETAIVITVEATPEATATP
jgi:ribose transport system substrate-binding protein